MSHGKKLAPRPGLLFFLFLADNPSKLWHLKINESCDIDENEIRKISFCRRGQEFYVYRVDTVSSFKSEKKLPHCKIIAKKQSVVLRKSHLPVV